MGMSRYKGKG